MTTQIIILPLSSPPDFTSSTPSPTTTTLLTHLKTILSTTGIQSIHYGTAIENPSLLLIFLEWDSSKNFETFINSSSYAHFSTLSPPTSPPKTIHIPISPTAAFSPSNPKIGATELVLFYFKEDIKEEEIKDVMGNVDKMRPVMERSECFEVFDGWSEESIPIPANPDTKGRVFVNIVAWESVEAHGKFAESDDFKANIHHLLGIQGILGNEMWHTKLFKV